MLNTNSDRLKPPFCPFCRQRIEPPVELDGLWFEFDGGACACGAHYTLDPTARNGGAVMQQAVVQACGGDWDKGVTMSPETDYEEGLIKGYNALNHRVGGHAFGTIYFVRLKDAAKEAEIRGSKEGVS